MLMTLVGTTILVVIALFLIALLLQSYFRFYSSDNPCPVESRYVFSSQGSPKTRLTDDQEQDIIDSDTEDDTVF
jgi:hypothetical protein